MNKLLLLTRALQAYRKGLSLSLSRSNPSMSVNYVIFTRVITKFGRGKLQPSLRDRLRLGWGCKSKKIQEDQYRILHYGRDRQQN